jgi:uncharacterized protein (TIGR04255 family)
MHLRNAPLVHVLAQVVFESVPGLSERIPTIQARFRELELLRLVEGFTHHVTVVEGATPTVNTKRRWDFLDRDRNTGIALSESALVLHTTRYRSAEPFLELLRRGIEVLGETTEVALVDRIGLRYVDLVRPEPTERFDQYVRAGVLGFPFDDADVGATIRAMRTEGVATTPDGTLVIRSILLPPGQFVPADLASSPLAYPTTLESTRTALSLDFDHFSEETVDFNPAAVIDRMTRLRVALRRAFEVACTAHAFERWGPWENA